MCIRDSFVKAFNVFLTYPFVDEVVGRDPQVARNLHMGDYTNLSVTLDVDLTKGLPTAPGIPTVPCIPLGEIPEAGPLPPADELCEGAINAINKCLQSPSLANCAGLPAFLITQVCNQLPVPGLCPGAGTSTTPGVPLPSVTIPGLPTLPAVPGLGRSGTGDTGDPGEWNDADEGGPTMAQLQEVYDPALVNLLVPQLVIQGSTKGDAQ